MSSHWNSFEDWVPASFSGKISYPVALLYPVALYYAFFLIDCCIVWIDILLMSIPWSLLSGLHIVRRRNDLQCQCLGGNMFSRCSWPLLLHAVTMLCIGSRSQIWFTLICFAHEEQKHGLQSTTLVIVIASWGWFLVILSIVSWWRIDYIYQYSLFIYIYIYRDFRRMGLLL